jgi:hypothetical protein
MTRRSTMKQMKRMFDRLMVGSVVMVVLLLVGWLG